MGSFWHSDTISRLKGAHRGYRACYPENTIAAFEASIGRCDFVEFDVGFSKDGVAIIIHDDTLSRTSDVDQIDGFEPPYNTIDYSYDELLKLDSSTWFIHTDPFGTIADGTADIEKLKVLEIQRIPTLKETLLLMRQNRMPVNIEIKDMTDTAFDSIAAKEVVLLVEELQLEDFVLISSFKHDYLSQAKRLNPKLCTAALQEHQHPDKLISYLQELKVEFYHHELDIVDSDTVEELLKVGIKTGVFTVNDTKEQKRLYNYGVATIFTDFL